MAEKRERRGQRTLRWHTGDVRHHDSKLAPDHSSFGQQNLIRTCGSHANQP